MNARRHLLTTFDAAMAITVKPEVIHQWASRGIVTPDGERRYLTRRGTGKTALWDWREIEEFNQIRKRRSRRVA